MPDIVIELVSFVAVIVSLIVIIHTLRRKRIAYYQSKMLGFIEVWQKSDGEKVLTINSYPHGISTDRITISKSYWYSIASKVLLLVKRTRNPHVLFFGLGANTSSSIIHQNNPCVRMTVIELDPLIVKVCRLFFHLDEMERIKIVIGDAYSLVNSRPDFNNTFDVIVIDIFTGIPPYVSTTTNTAPFIKSAMKWLTKDGAMVFNRPANIKKDRTDTKILVSYLKTQFKTVESSYINDPRGYKNDVIVAFKKRLLR